MKAKIVPLLLTGFFFAIIFYSCEDSTYKEYKANVPVYLSYENLRGSVSLQQNVSLKNPGKIFFKDNFIFIVEELEGIHVYDNTDPAAPLKKVFIKLPGVIDIAISGYTMYADSFVDMVIFDLQNIDNIKEVGRLQSIFPYYVPPTGNDYPMAYVDNTKGVVKSWNLKTIREKVYNNPEPYPVYYDKVFLNSAMSGTSSGVSSNGIGVGGSMARFGIKDQVLYLLDKNTLKIYNIANKTSPSKFNEIYPGSGIETMFLTDKNMFLGTTSGMIIYDISVPLSPASRKIFNHARSCDPVIVDDTLAYITLRTGTGCGGTVNCLDVVNIKDLSKPKLAMSYSMTNPHGLGKDGDLLFICDGSAGLKIYDAGNPLLITSNLVKAYPGINAYDVIPIGNVLILIGDDGLYQYNYSNVSNITMLSKIPVVVVN